VKADRTAKCERNLKKRGKQKNALQDGRLIKKSNLGIMQIQKANTATMQGLSTYATSLPKWQGQTSRELEILAAKYTGRQIGKMELPELNAKFLQVVADVCTIAGWTFTNDGLSAKVLLNAVRVKALAEWAHLTPDELGTAVTLHPVKDWGKQFNIALLSESVEAYMIERSEISKIEERNAARHTILEQEVLPEHTDAEILESAISLFKALGRPEFISARVYPILIKEGKITPSEREIELLYRKHTARAKLQMTDDPAFAAWVRGWDGQRKREYLMRLVQKELCANWMEKYLTENNKTNENE
jgi:hypothetical protein